MGALRMGTRCEGGGGARGGGGGASAGGGGGPASSCRHGLPPGGDATPTAHPPTDVLEEFKECVFGAPPYIDVRNFCLYLTCGLLGACMVESLPRGWDHLSLTRTFICVWLLPAYCLV